MDKRRIYWVLIFLTLAVNVLMLHQTIEAYYGQEYHIVYRNTAVAMVSVFISLIVYFGWRKKEYSK
ncbi:hypothetical protein [Bacillus sp. Marseille-P3661]|uniref:hypothetical protein n=1 Tax=Bacillus sp. Marseille-P3661 TaxID=1936234 RepID=UPI000C820E7D|nr:hypothetical protein [Bacillus sp. Marseille-P3661]